MNGPRSAKFQYLKVQFYDHVNKQSIYIFYIHEYDISSNGVHFFHEWRFKEMQNEKLINTSFYVSLAKILT